MRHLTRQFRKRLDTANDSAKREQPRGRQEFMSAPFILNETIPPYGIPITTTTIPSVLWVGMGIDDRFLFTH